ncbi:MAG: glycosyltransferase family 39 protein [Ardenticatenaceae bacterium]|nr:glycosyltransferase family 39 protein [Ardenticatenaceae bacterium]MCB9443233.1 glycosyltransferase family 39 protein [Ardenticatenaceae bacterium]
MSPGNEVAEWQSGKVAKWLPTRLLRNSATILYVAGLLIFFALAVATAVASSPTVDESVHVFRGRVLWQTGDLRFQAKHMPLTHWLNGSLLFTEPTLPDVTTLPSWAKDDRPVLAREFLWEHEPQPNIDRIFLLARLPIIWLGLLLGAVLARWGRSLSGSIGQSTAVLLFAFSPNLLANFSLATTDGPLAATYVMAVFAWYWYGKRPSRRRWVLAGIALGLALASKLTAILLLPVLFLLSYSGWRRGDNWWRPGLRFLSILPLAGLLFWALYGFELRPLPGIPVPVPAASYVNSVFELQVDTGMQAETSSNYRAYLLGETSRDGWWYYFIVAFLIKTPLPTLILAGTAVYFIIRRRQWRQTAWLWLPPAVLFAFASFTGLNIGYRHILPVLPFAILLASTAAPLLPRSPAPLLPLFLWYAIASLHQAPHYLAYFNETIGGPRQGYHYLADSNIDWGQSLRFLADYVNNSDEDSIRISYFGAADPAYLGLDIAPLFDGETGQSLNFARANPLPGQYAISVNHLVGQVLLEGDMFDWFRRQKPVDYIGYSILVYDVPAQAQGEWVAFCSNPAPLLDGETVVQLLGQSEFRSVYFDCRSSWVFPDDGAPGWYILPQQESWPIAEQFPDSLKPVYVHDASALEPSYAVWYWDGQADLNGWTAVSSSPIATIPVANLMGYTAKQSEWWTIWQVQAETTEPLTIAGHLYGDAPTPLVADGLGFSSEQWQPGDWLVQMHRFEDGENGRYLETGLYNYLTGDRLADFVQIRP